MGHIFLPHILSKICGLLGWLQRAPVWDVYLEGKSLHLPLTLGRKVTPPLPEVANVSGERRLRTKCFETEQDIYVLSPSSLYCLRLGPLDADTHSR